MKGQTPHPLIPEIPAEMFRQDFEKAKVLFAEREERIALEKADPIRYGYEPPHWAEASEAAAKYRDVLVMGGNRSGKSTWAGKEVMRMLASSPDKRAWCFQTTNDNSISMQQPILWDFMPAELREAKRNRVTNISYTQKNGFSENTFVLPNRSQCWFRNYAQDIKTIEGGEIDIVWCDELVPLDWLETIRYRLVTRNGILIVTFTPVEGYSPTVKEYLQGAKTLKEIDAELLPKRSGKGFEKVPLLQKCVRNSAVIYFHTAANPWAGYERMKVELATQPREKILCRAYGVPVKAIATSFPKFSEPIHVVREEHIPAEGTVYHFVDPAGRKPWFMIWVRIDSEGQAWVYREWPQCDEYIEGYGYPDEWAKPSGKLHDGEIGDGQSPIGWGLGAYINEILRLEKLDGVTPFERWIDSRYANTTVAGNREHATTLLEDLEIAGMPFSSCPAENIAEGVGFINDWLYYNENLPLFTDKNSPRLYISERCTNTIFALKEWTGKDGQKGACKDPIDCLRFLVSSGVQNVEGGILNVTGGGSY